jgi:hypothetical protein
LDVQRRMRTEVSRLVRHVYPHLKDDPTTMNRPHILGVDDNVFLFHHEVGYDLYTQTDVRVRLLKCLELPLKKC